MARDIKVLIGGNAAKAEAALNHLKDTGRDVTDDLGRDFAKLGEKADSAFVKKRQAAKDAYGRISASGKASASEIARAEKGLASQLKKIDQEQFGKRTSMLNKFKVGWIGTAAAMGASYAAINFGKKAVEDFKQFETALVDMSKVTDEPLDQIKEKIMELPAELGNATDMVEGYYQVISAGVTKPVEAMDLLTTAAKGAKAAHIEQGDMIKALTKLMAGFSGEIQNSTDASDLLFNIERYGQTTVQELAPVIGNLASISNQLNVMPGEMAAFVAQFTQTAGSTAQAATQYEAVLTGFLKPTKTMFGVIKKLGYESGEALIGDKGLTGALQLVKEAADNTKGGIGKLFESKEALIGLGPQFATNFGNVKKTMDDINTSAGATDQAFQDWQKTFAATEEIFDNTVNKIMIELGEELAPLVNKGMLEFSDWVSNNREGITSFFSGLVSLIGGVADAGAKFVDFVQGAADVAAEVSLWFGDQGDAGRAGAGQDGWMNDYGENYATGGAAPVASADPNAKFGTYAIGSQHTGTSYVPKTGLYHLNRGEQVLNRQEAKQSQGGSSATISVPISITVIESKTPQQTYREIARQLLPELDRLKPRYT